MSKKADPRPFGGSELDYPDVPGIFDASDELLDSIRELPRDEAKLLLEHALCAAGARGERRDLERATTTALVDVVGYAVTQQSATANARKVQRARKRLGVAPRKAGRPRAK
jgi:hypothetical protein